MPELEPQRRPDAAPFTLAMFLSGLVATGVCAVIGVLSGSWDPLTVTVIVYVVGLFLAAAVDSARGTAPERPARATAQDVRR